MGFVKMIVLEAPIVEASGCTDFCFVLNPQYFVSILGGSCLTDPRGVWILTGIRARAAPLPPGRSRCRY